MKRHHPLAGFLMALVAVFIDLGPRCGVVGRGIHNATVLLFGHTGLALLVLGLLVSGLAVSGLGGLLWRLALASWKARRARPQLVRAVPRVVTPKTFHVVLQAAPPVPPPIVAPPAPPVIPAAVSRELDDVRSGLKYMGYKPAEIESAIQKIDTTKSVADMLKDGLAVLRKKAA
jgi:RuvA, C-terminal domain